MFTECSPHTQGRKPSKHWDATAAVLEANPEKWVPLAPSTAAHDARQALARRGEFVVRTVAGRAEAKAAVRIPASAEDGAQ